MTEQEMQEQIARYEEGLQESYNKRMKLEKRVRELEAENADLKKHCEWLEQNLNLKNTVVDDLKNQLRDALRGTSGADRRRETENF